MGNVEETSIKKGVEQILRIKSLLETFFCSEIDFEKWTFIGALGFKQMNETVKCCKRCKEYVIQSSDMGHFLDKIHTSLQQRENLDSKDYSQLVKNLLYTVYANPGPVTKDKVDEEIFSKVVGREDKEGH